MLDVDDQIPVLQIAEVGPVGAEGLRLALPPGLGAGAEDVGIGDHRQPQRRVDEARRHLGDDQLRVEVRVEQRRAERARSVEAGAVGRAAEDLGVGRGDDLRHQIAVEQHPPQLLGLRGAVAGDVRDRAPLAQRLQLLHQRVERAGLAVVAGDLGAQGRRLLHLEGDLRLAAQLVVELRGVLPQELLRARERRRFEADRRERQQALVLEVQPHVALVEEVQVGPQRELALALRRLERALQLGPQVVPLPLELERVVEHPERVAGQVFGEGREALFVEARQDRREARGEERVVGRGVLQLVDQLAQAAGRDLHRVGGRAHRGDGGLAPLVVEDDLAGGAERQLLERRRRALRDRVEGLDGLDQVAEELDARGEGQQRAPDVEDAAADRERARVLDDGRARVARRLQLERELVAVLLHLGFQERRAAVEHRAGQHAPRQRAHRDHQRARAGLGLRAEVEVEERGHPRLAHQAVGGEAFVGEHLVGRDAQDRRRGGGRARGGVQVGALRPFQIACEEAQVLLERVGPLFIGDHTNERPPRGERELHQRVAARGADQPARARPLRPLHRPRCGDARERRQQLGERSGAGLARLHEEPLRLSQRALGRLAVVRRPRVRGVGLELAWFHGCPQQRCENAHARLRKRSAGGMISEGAV